MFSHLFFRHVVFILHTLILSPSGMVSTVVYSQVTLGFCCVVVLVYSNHSQTILLSLIAFFAHFFYLFINWSTISHGIFKLSMEILQSSPRFPPF